MNYLEQALSFPCQGESLVGILSLPERPGPRGVLVIVGGPQYRAGSHRQFTLLARGLAAQGVPVLRFDYRGMGDSTGPQRDFEAVEDDVRAAIDQFHTSVPGLRQVVLWGLCDGASAALFYAHRDPRVAGLVLLNPWARTDSGLAKARLKHYYLRRLADPALWRKIISGRFNPLAAARGLLQAGRAATGAAPADASANSSDSASASAPARAPLTERMRDGWTRFPGPVLLLLSGADLTAREFLDMAQASRPWRALMAAPRVTRQRLEEADHTFSRQAWRDQVTDWTGEWLRSW